MKTQCFLLSILYAAGIFNSFSNSQMYDDPIEIYDNSSSTDISSDPSKRSGNNNVEKPKICQQSIITDINSRYASTVVTTRVTNPTDKKQEYIFSFHVPNTAFITSFVIEINNKNYTSTVLEKEEANKQFKKVAAIKSSDPLESVRVRNTQKFSISISLEALSVATLYLNYEEMLIRNHGQYEHVINIFPGQVVENLHVEIFLKETSKIIDLKIPNIRSGNEIQNQDKELNPHAYISEDRESGDLKSVKILFIPKEEEQRKFARIMKTNENRGFAGQFVVQYDVENKKEFGEIIASNGYFVSFFAPKGLDPLTKHVIFVLDISSSMKGKRIDQLKAAMNVMLNQLRKNDLLTIIEFNGNVQVWSLESTKKVLYSEKGVLKANVKLPKPSLATPDNIKKAIDSVNKFTVDGKTDIFSALKAGLQAVELGKKFDQIERQPLIMFLTDGATNVGETSPQKIKDQITKLNKGVKRSPISTLAFGDSANQNLLIGLAVLNMGFFKHIYDADDSQLQIEDFFKTISVPVLANVYFKYNMQTVSNTTLTEFPLCYDGLDLTVAGQYNGGQVFKQPMVEAMSNKGPLTKGLKVYNSTTNFSHHWAFITTKQLLNKIIINSSGNQKDYIKQIVAVCSKYSFVTPFTSMVITTPAEKLVLGISELTGQANSKPDLSVDESMKYLGLG